MNVPANPLWRDIEDMKWIYKTPLSKTESIKPFFQNVLRYLAQQGTWKLAQVHNFSQHSRYCTQSHVLIGHFLLVELLVLQEKLSRSSLTVLF